MFIHHFVCLLVFPFVRLLSILVVQRRILFVWKLERWLSGETLWGLSCLMPGPPRRVGTSLLRNVKLRRKGKSGWRKQRADVKTPRCCIEKSKFILLLLRRIKSLFSLSHQLGSAYFISVLQRILASDFYLQMKLALIIRQMRKTWSEIAAVNICWEIYWRTGFKSMVKLS